MGLYDILTNPPTTYVGGWPQSITGDGTTPSILPGSQDNSVLHAGMAPNDPGYSLNGSYGAETVAAANSYNTGPGNGVNGLRPPSSLDLDGVDQARYLDNPPQ
jgi:hypothetical protein